MSRRNDIPKILIIGPKLRRSVTFAVILFLLSVALPWTVQACVRSTPVVKVSGDFHIIVRHDETPIAGIQVEFYDEAQPEQPGSESGWKPFRTLVTATDGTAEIRNLAKGRYLAAIKGPGGGYAVHVEVTDELEKSHEVPLYWPFSPSGLLKTRSLSGVLGSNNPWKPFQNVEVQLWAVGIESPLEVENAGPQGGFHFKEVRPGLYVIRVHGQQDGVEPHNQVVGDVAVELSSSAPEALASISLLLDMTDCGIAYSACAANDKAIKTPSRRIQVLYPPGMAEFPTIDGARYKLLNDKGISIADGITDKNGMADLPYDAMGRTTLIVASPLMTTLQQSLDLLTPNRGAPDLTVTLDQLEKCSTVTLEKNATP